MPQHDYEVIALHVPFLSFWLKNENVVIVRRKSYLEFNASKSTYMSETLTSRSFSVLQKHLKFTISYKRY